MASFRCLAPLCARRGCGATAERIISAFVVSYGYLAVFAGALLEGETILLSAGFAANLGLLHLPLVIAVAFAGATIGDQIAFLLGRWKGPLLIARFPALARRAPRVHALLERHDVLFILAVRFLYGLRIAGPVVIGSSRVPFARFAVLNIIGAAIWAVLVAGAGYYLGAAMTALLTDIRRIEDVVLIGIPAVGFAVWLWRRWRAAPARVRR